MATLMSLSNLFAAFSSALAAFFWYRAAQVEAPPAVLRGSAGYGSRTSPSAPNASVDASPMVEYARESGKRNKTAALWSAVAALFAFLGWGVGAYLSWSAIIP